MFVKRLVLLLSISSKRRRVVEDPANTYMEAQDGGDEHFADAQEGKTNDAICYWQQPIQTPDDMQCVRYNALVNWYTQLESKQNNCDAPSSTQISFVEQYYNELSVQPSNTIVD